jgi:alpha-1,3-rhamnosyltransferase
VSEFERPMVTVVIASYNHINYIEKTLESIISQDYKPVEILIIDDGSTDGSGEFLQSIQDKYSFRLIRRENGGLVSVINLGIIEAQGDYIIFHASDDESLPGRISGQLNVLQRHPNAAFVSGNVAFVAEDGRSRGNLLKVTDEERELEFDDLFLHRAKVSSVASMYRASALKKMGSISERYRAEDPQIFLRLTYIGYTWIQWAGKPVIAYRMLFTSQSRTIMPLLLRQQIQLVKEFSNHKLYPKALAQVTTSLLSVLAEQNKISALKELTLGGFDILNVGFLRIIVKLILPKKWHSLFKRAGNPT